MAMHDSDRPSETEPRHARPYRGGTHGDRIGPYKILEMLGEGGMGVVYLAEQTEPMRRRVALKVIKPGMDSKAVIARFEVEEQALALMDHPSVAKVFDAGTTDEGRPYFVMEHVAGVPITEHCDRQKLSIEQRLHLFMQVCEAVQHAHQKGVIHRDIKPSNILVAVKDGQSVPKIIDFGVAKAIAQPLTEKTLFTEQGQLIGTPSYMSPEQAEMTAQDVDTRTDIYSLGVLLYELLTGVVPFDPSSLRRAAFDEIRRIIREVEPPKPSTKLSTLEGEPPPSAGADEVKRETARTKPHGSGVGSALDVAKRRRADPKSLVRQVRGDLDWITMKALEKDRARRYASASDFAADIRRHLSHEPVVAGPPSATYRVKKFARRNRGVVVAASVIALVLLAATGVSIRFALSEAEQRRIAVAAEQEQSRAREEAEDAREEAEFARASEEKQRKLAEQREVEAVAARASEEEQRELAEQRADELQTVTEFQSSMLSDIDIEEMGRGIIADQRDRIRERLESESAPGEEIEAALLSFDEVVRWKINATDLARKVMDDNVLARAVETIDKDFADQPLVRAALEQTVAVTYVQIGLYERAMPLQQAALTTRRDRLGDDHPHTLISIGRMGSLLRAMGKYEEALPYYREALEGRRRVLGNDHLETLASINRMGGLLDVMGKYPEAEPYLREAVEGCRRVLGDDHPNTLQSINNMAELYMNQGRYDEAEPLFGEVLRLRRQVLGQEHPDTLTSLVDVGWVHRARGELAKSEPYYRQTLEGRRRVLGKEHAHTLRVMAQLASLLGEHRKYAEAEPYAREALEGKRRVLGDDHPGTLTSIGNMGALLRAMGKNEEALPYYREALEGCRRVLGDDHPDALDSINNMGVLLQAMGKYEEALPYYREALEGYRRVLGDDHPDTLIAIHNMGRLLRDLGRLEEGEALGAEAVRGVKANLAPTHDFRLAALGQHGRTLAVMQKYPEAEGELLEAYEGFVKTLGSDHQRTIKVIGFLIDLYDAWHEAQPDQGYDAEAAEWRAKLPRQDPASSLITLGLKLLEKRAYAKAEAVIEECLAIREEVLSEGHWLIFNTRSILGAALAAQGVDRSLTVAARIEKLREAEALLLGAYDSLKDHGDAPDERKHEALQRIVDLYDAWHAAEPDEGYGAKAAVWRAKLPEPEATEPRDKKND